jgi:hypothetical protein
LLHLQMAHSFVIGQPLIEQGRSLVVVLHIRAVRNAPPPLLATHDTIMLSLYGPLVYAPMTVTQLFIVRFYSPHRSCGSTTDGPYLTTCRPLYSKVRLMILESVSEILRHCS